MKNGKYRKTEDLDHQVEVKDVTNKDHSVEAFKKEISRCKAKMYEIAEVEKSEEEKLDSFREVKESVWDKLNRISESEESDEDSVNTIHNVKHTAYDSHSDASSNEI